MKIFTAKLIVISIFVSAIFGLVSGAKVIAAESFDTGGESGQKYWDEHFGTPKGSSFGSQGKNTAGSSEGFSRDDALAVIMGMITGEFKDPEFMRALFDYMMLDPTLTAKNVQGTPRMPDLAELYGYVKENYPDVAESADGQKAASLVAGQDDASKQLRQSYTESYNKIAAGQAAKPELSQGTVKSDDDLIANAVKKVDGKAVIGKGHTETAVVGKAAESNQKGSTVVQSKDDGNFLQRASDAVWSALVGVTKPIQIALSWMNPIKGKDTDTAVTSKTESKVKDLSSPAKQAKELGGESNPSYVPGEVDANGVAKIGYKPTQTPNTEYKPTQNPNTDYKPTQTPNTDYKPTQSPNTDYKPTQNLNTNYKPTQDLNTDYKPTQNPNTDYKPTQNLNTDYKPTQSPNTEYKPTQYPAGYDSETSVANVGGADKPSYVPAGTGSFNAGAAAEKPASENKKNGGVIGWVSDTYNSAATWIQHFFNF